MHAQDLKIDEEIFVSDKYLYSYNKMDSTLYKYSNHPRIANEVPIKIKAQYKVIDKGFGFIDKYPRSIFNKPPIDKCIKGYDSIYFQISPKNDQYRIEFTKKMGNEIMLIDSVFRYLPDTVKIFRELLLSNDYSIPYLYVKDNNSGIIIFLKYKEKVSWKDENSTQYFDITPENKNHVNNIINSLVHEVYYKSKNKISESPYNISLKFIDFKINKTQLDKMIEMLKKDQIIIEVEEDKPKIVFDNSDFSNLLRKSFFISNNGYPLILDSSIGRIRGRTSFNNIYEINDSLIKYTSSSTHIVNGVPVTKTDTLSTNVIKNSKYNYILDKDESISKISIFKEKDDTITEFKYAIKNNMIEIKDLKIINLLNDKLILKISIDDNIIINNGQDLYLKENRSLKLKEGIKDLLIRNNFPRIDAPYEVVFKLNEIECSTFHNKKNIDSFMKKIKRCTSKTSR